MGATEKWNIWFEGYELLNFSWHCLALHKALSVHISNKKMKRCQASLIIRKIQIKIRIKHHIYHFGFINFKKIDNAKDRDMYSHIKVLFTTSIHVSGKDILGDLLKVITLDCYNK